MIHFWKFLKFVILLVLCVVLLFIIWKYSVGVDWKNEHTSWVESLPKYGPSVDSGSYVVDVKDKTFHILVEGGQNKGPNIMLLHGFPESAMMWLDFMKSASANGYRVFAFDQRGYSPGARPTNREAYHIDSLVQDVINIADQLNLDKFHLVGHDWGSMVGWTTTMQHPVRIESWTAMAIPHPQVFLDGLMNNEEQQRRSSYMNKLRLPYFPEFFFRMTQNRIVKSLENSWKLRELDQFESIFKERGALTSALNWYRALEIEKFQSEAKFEKSIQVPTLFIFGNDDPVVAPDLIPLQKEYVDTTYHTLFLNTGHALIQKETEKVTQAILKQVSANSMTDL